MMATRLRPGAICVSNSSHLPPIAGFDVDETSDISARVGQARNEAFANRIGDRHKYDRDRSSFPAGGQRSPELLVAEDYIGLKFDQLFRKHSPHSINAGPAQRTSIRTLRPSVQPNSEAPGEPGKPSRCLRIVFVCIPSVRRSAESALPAAPAPPPAKPPRSQVPAMKVRLLIR